MAGFLQGVVQGAVDETNRAFDRAGRYNNQVALENLRSSNRMKEWKQQEDETAPRRKREADEAAQRSIDEYGKRKEFDEKFAKQKADRDAEDFATFAIGHTKAPDNPYNREHFKSLSRSGTDSKEFVTNHLKSHMYSVGPDGNLIVKRNELLSEEPVGNQYIPIRLENGTIVEALPFQRVQHSRESPGVKNPTGDPYFYRDRSGRIVSGKPERAINNAERDDINKRIDDLYGADKHSFLMDRLKPIGNQLIINKFDKNLPAFREATKLRAEQIIQAGETNNVTEAVARAIKEMEKAYEIQIYSDPTMDKLLYGNRPQGPGQQRPAPGQPQNFDAQLTEVFKIPDGPERESKIEQTAVSLNGGRPLTFLENGKMDVNKLTPEAKNFLIAAKNKAAQPVQQTQPTPTTTPTPTQSVEAPRELPNGPRGAPEMPGPIDTGKSIINAGKKVIDDLNSRYGTPKSTTPAYRTVEEEDAGVGIPATKPNEVTVPIQKAGLTVKDVLPTLPPKQAEALSAIADNPIPASVDTENELAAYLALAAAAMGITGVSIAVTPAMKNFMENNKLAQREAALGGGGGEPPDGPQAGPNRGTQANDNLAQPPKPVEEPVLEAKKGTFGKRTTPPVKPSVTKDTGGAPVKTDTGGVPTKPEGQVPVEIAELPEVEMDTSAKAAAMKIPKNRRAAEVEQIKLAGMKPDKRAEVITRLKADLADRNTDKAAVAQLVLDSVERNKLPITPSVEEQERLRSKLIADTKNIAEKRAIQKMSWQEVAKLLAKAIR